MTVPSRPVAGAPIEVAWGAVVHDNYVAVDIQFGDTTVPAGGGSILVTLPRAMGFFGTILCVPRYTGGPPWMVVNPEQQSAGVSFWIHVRDVSGSGANTIPAPAVRVDWVVIGSRV